MFEELSKESEEEFLKDLMEIRNLNNNKSAVDWYDKNKFKKIFTTKKLLTTIVLIIKIK